MRRAILSVMALCFSLPAYAFNSYVVLIDKTTGHRVLLLGEAHGNTFNKSHLIKLIGKLDAIETAAKAERRDLSSSWYYELNPAIAKNPALIKTGTYSTLFELAPSRNSTSACQFIAFDPRPLITSFIRGFTAELEEMKIATQIEHQQGQTFADTSGFQALQGMDSQLRTSERDLVEALRKNSAPSIKDYRIFLQESHAGLVALNEKHQASPREADIFKEWLATLSEATQEADAIFEGHQPEDFLFGALTSYLVKSESLDDLIARDARLNAVLDGVELSLADAFFFDKILEDRSKKAFTVMMNGSKHTVNLKHALVLSGYQVTNEFHPQVEVDEDGIETEIFDQVQLIAQILARVQEVVR